MDNFDRRPRLVAGQPPNALEVPAEQPAASAPVPAVWPAASAPAAPGVTVETLSVTFDGVATFATRSQPAGSEFWGLATFFDWVVPDGVYQIFIETWGSGGGGESGGASTGGGGAGGGAYAAGYASVFPGLQLCVQAAIPGNGGNGSENKADGNLSAVLGVMAPGGSSGSSTGGAGGLASGALGSVRFSGGSGGVPGGGSIRGGTAGGSSGGSAADGVAGGNSTTTGGTFPGVAPTDAGAGGAGGSNRQTGANGTAPGGGGGGGGGGSFGGGDGGSGRVRITYQKLTPPPIPATPAIAIGSLREVVAMCGEGFLPPLNRSAGTYTTGAVDSRSFRHVVFLLDYGAMGASTEMRSWVEQSADGVSGWGVVPGTATIPRLQAGGNNKALMAEVDTALLDPVAPFLRMRVLVSVSTLNFAVFAFGLGDLYSTQLLPVASSFDIAGMVQRVSIFGRQNQYDRRPSEVMSFIATPLHPGSVAPGTADTGGISFQRCRRGLMMLGIGAFPATSSAQLFLQLSQDNAVFTSPANSPKWTSPSIGGGISNQIAVVAETSRDWVKSVNSLNTYLRARINIVGSSTTLCLMCLGFYDLLVPPGGLRAIGPDRGVGQRIFTG